MHSRSTTEVHVISRQVIVVVLVTLVIMITDVQPKFPSSRDATSNLTEVKCVGLVINKNDKSKCQGTFLTQKHMATSCRCIGTTDKTTGVYTQGNPVVYEVQSWSNAPIETRNVEELFFYYNCGVEPRKVLMDLGLIKTSAPFSLGAVSPAELPDAMPFRFYEYIYRLQILETRCFTSNLDKPAGSVVEVTVKPYVHCPTKRPCIGPVPDCEWLLLQANHICAVPKPINPPTTEPPVTDPASSTTAPTIAPTQPPIYPPCTASAGAPLLCHKMLVGINARTPDCNDKINSHQFMRIDYTMKWLSSRIC